MLEEESWGAVILSHVKDQAGSGVDLRVEGGEQRQGDNRFHETGREGNLGGPKHEGEGGIGGYVGVLDGAKGQRLVITTMEPM